MSYLRFCTLFVPPFYASLVILFCWAYCLSTGYGQASYSPGGEAVESMNAGRLSHWFIRWHALRLMNDWDNRSTLAIASHARF
jgi:hypothetical protein